MTIISNNFNDPNTLVTESNSGFPEVTVGTTETGMCDAD